MAATKKVVFFTTDKTQLFDKVFSLQSSKDSVKKLADSLITVVITVNTQINRDQIWTESHEQQFFVK
jgi:hypothetical protein